MSMNGHQLKNEGAHVSNGGASSKMEAAVVSASNEGGAGPCNQMTNNAFG